LLAVIKFSIVSKVASLVLVYLFLILVQFLQAYSTLGSALPEQPRLVEGINSYPLKSNIDSNNTNFSSYVPTRVTAFTKGAI
jgi:hypothetical protein